MTDVSQIDLTKKNLAAMPIADLLLLGHATNEITVFSKLILMASQATPKIKVVKYVQAGQIFILMRALIGKLHEAWELFVKRFQSDRNMTDKYLPKLNVKATAALDSLKKHFGKSSPLTPIRNEFSFHYRDDKDLVEKSFQEIPDDEVWHFYLSNMEGNCFYYASELVVALGVMKLSNLIPDRAEPNVIGSARRFEALCDLIIDVSRQIQILFGECITEIVNENLPTAQIGEKSEKIELADAPDLKDDTYPVLFQRSRAWVSPRIARKSLRTITPIKPNAEAGIFAASDNRRENRTPALP